MHASEPWMILADMLCAMQANLGPETMQQFVASGQGGVVTRTSLTDYMQRRLTKLPLNDEEDLELPE